MKSLRSEEKILIVIASIAILLRISMFGFGILTQGNSYFFAFDDAKGYMDPIIQLMSGHGYSADYYGTLFPETARTPGYPLLIAASLYLFNSFLPLIVLQLIIGSVLPILAYFLVIRLFGSQSAATATAIFFAIDPLIVTLATLLMTETIFMALFLSGCLLFLKACADENGRWKFLVAAGLALSYAALIRPVLFYSFPIFAMYLAYKVIKRLSWQHTTYSVLIFLVALGTFTVPWIVRNDRRAGLAEMTSLSGIIAYFYTSPSILSIVDGKTYSEERQELRLRARAATGIMELRDPRNIPYFKSETIRIIREHPKETMLLAGLSLFHLLTHDGYLDTFLQTGLLTHAPQSTAQINALARGEFSKLFEIVKSFLSFPWILFVMTRLLWIMISLLAVIGIFHLMRKKPEQRDTLVFVLSVMATLTIATLPVALGIHGRLRIPLDVFLIPLALIGAQVLLHIFRRTPQTAIPPAQTPRGEKAFRNNTF